VFEITGNNRDLYFETPLLQDDLFLDGILTGGPAGPFEQSGYIVIHKCGRAFWYVCVDGGQVEPFRVGN
jgi:hypothetical protein